MKDKTEGSAQRCAGLALVVGLTLGVCGSLAAEEAVQVKASSPDAKVKLLTAAHTGKTICELDDGTALTFIQRADHGPHKFAKVEVLEGACSGTTGYISWFALDPKPGG